MSGRLIGIMEDYWCFLGFFGSSVPMFFRSPSDHRAGLNHQFMKSFEQEIKAFLQGRQLQFRDNSSSFKRLDFSVPIDDKIIFYFDAKEKRQHYNLRNWNIPSKETEEYTFIIDDLAARKILAYAPYSGMIVRDNLRSGYFFFSVLDLYLMPKKRVNRPIQKEKQALKGKWIIDLRNGNRCESMGDCWQQILQYIEKREDLFLNILECFGNYTGEHIGQSGEVRRPEHWDTDVKETR